MTSDESDEDVIARINAALEDWERRGDAAHWVPEKYMPEQPVREPSSYSTRIEDLIGTTLHDFQRVWLDRLERGEFSIAPVYQGVRRYVGTSPGLRSGEEMRERMKLVRGPGVDMVIIDEAVLEPDFFGEAPLFGRQDAGLDDLEPDGPVWLDDPVEIEFEETEVSPEYISIFTGMPVKKRRRVARVLRALTNRVRQAKKKR